MVVGSWQLIVGSWQLVVLGLNEIEGLYGRRLGRIVVPGHLFDTLAYRIQFRRTLLDELTPHLHLGATVPEGPRSRLSRTAMLALAVTIHNLPEGMAVGVVFAGAEQGVAHLSLTSALAVSLGIAIQNVPEGAIISMPLRAEGNSRWSSFLLGTLSGVVEPLGGLAVVLLASLLTPALPYLLAFAAGAMFYVVVEELIPEASAGIHSNLSTIGFAIGFVLMMVLDVVLG